MNVRLMKPAPSERRMPSRRIAAYDEESTVVLGILSTVGREGQVSQRTLAAELGIALGLINAYVKRCVKKGLIKVQRVPPRRYAYYLTPRGFAEKSRLTASYLSHSFGFFRRARHDCEETLRLASERGLARVALLGSGDLAEIAVICALESTVSVAAIVDPSLSRKTFIGVPVVADLDSVASTIDAAILTDTRAPAETFANAVARLGAAKVLVPPLLRSALAEVGTEQGGAA
jgi:DNA-binding MarR family transcriptional regulator